MEAVRVPPALHLVADARDVGGVGPAAAAHVAHAQRQPLLDEHLHRLALVAVDPAAGVIQGVTVGVLYSRVLQLSW